MSRISRLLSRQSASSTSDDSRVAKLVVQPSSQPEPVSTMGPDTSQHYMTDLTWKHKAQAKEWLISKAKEKMCVAFQSKHVDFKKMEMVCERGGKREKVTKNQIQNIHTKKGNQHSKEEDERLSQLSKNERAEEKRKEKEKYDEERDLWKDFLKDRDHLDHSKTEVKYYSNLQKFIDDWSTDHKKVVEYFLNTWLNPWKEKFVYAWTNRYKHFKNESISIAKQSHGRLKKLWKRIIVG
ncbi:uncharacterized protein LOC113295151 [Papaver somniferum]|uniref:uncharacterized protein LOC113295151 n=1 Tax=Papaver somniferum TaxID=3469 RepID=UPI000E6F56D1|nr:uncharacterized protein LOC113295151 [Papaver somniferum]